ncbi:winged helix-turn-helix domain-containing protein [Pseudoduganella sp. RAF19]|uniref:ATP-binding protein n=1 Tax=Pseudoduganella sp. RAF19 TaxID=3233052 RepID=UPI003F9666F7
MAESDQTTYSGPSASADTALLFGDFRLVPSERALFHREQPVRISGRAFDLLLALAERPGEIVSKTELMARAWPRTFVEESNLRVHIATLRKLLSPGADGKPYVENVVGRGYSFVAPVARASRGHSAPAPSVPRLPVLNNRLIGRDDVLNELVEQVSLRRLLTIVGTGGMGKTALAVAAAHQLMAPFSERVHFLDLSAIGDACRLPTALALALGLPTVSADPVSGMLDYLRQGATLIVFDNCEHIVDQVAELAGRLLRETLGVHILATSREALRADGEWVYRLAPLAVPPSSIGPSLLPTDALASFSAVQLFVERASACIGGLALGTDGLRAVVEICRRLDGIPLAIELAAGRAGFFGVHGLAERLADSFAVLTNGSRTALPRHQTLRATLDWSHATLSALDRAVFRRLGLFRTSFTLACAVEVAHCPLYARTDVEDALSNLIAKSLLTTVPEGDQVSYRLLETTRAYALEKLRESGEFHVVAERAAFHLSALLERAAQERERAVPREWLAQYGRYLEHVGGSLDWAFDLGGDVRLGQRLCVLSAPLWDQLSLLNEYGARLEKALKADISHLPPDPALELELNLALGVTLAHTGVAGDPRRQAVFARALELAMQGEDREVRLRALYGSFTDATCRADYRAALALGECYGMECAYLGSERAAMNHASLMARAQFYHGALDEARDQIEFLSNHPLNTHCEPVPEFQLVSCLATRTVLSRILWLQGFPQRAMQLACDSVNEATQLNHDVSMCFTLQHACTIAGWNGDKEASVYYARLLQQQGRRSGMPQWEFWGRAMYAAHLGVFDPDHPQRESMAALSRSPYFGAWQADVLTTLNQDMLTPRAIARAQAHHAGWCEAEVMRAWGESLLRVGAEDRAEDLFQRALEQARSQNALAWELRAAMSLARLWLSQERADEAGALLRPVLERYTEGHNTADLRAAAALLLRC